VVKDHKDLVHNPTYVRFRHSWTKLPSPSGCWGISHKKSLTLDHNQCMNNAREGHLTCGVHRHLEDRAHMLRRAQNDKRLR
jgi:hypothetical protein